MVSTENTSIRKQLTVFVVHGRLLRDLLHLDLRDRTRNGFLEGGIDILLLVRNILHDCLRVILL